jgi:cytidyltransferase-like protein
MIKDISAFYSKNALSMKRSEIRELLKFTRQPDIISFAGGLPGPETFPVKEMEEIASQTRRVGKIIALVPTMGYFHEGHLSLMREGRRRGDLLVVSLFVNPTQFAPHEDFKSYPRDFERDRKMTEDVGVDILFVPETIYLS